MLFLTAAGTIALVAVAFLAYQKFLSQEALKTQMDIVIQLVKDLSAAKIPIELRYPASTKTPSSKWNYNVFEIAFRDEKDVFHESLNWEVIIMKMGLFAILDKSFTHLGNPLLPNSIAQKLWKLKKTGVRTPNETDWSKMNYYVVGSFQTTDEAIKTALLHPEKMHGFKMACIELKKSITDWFEDHKVQNTNTVAFMNIDG
jgi:hypothetical protein